MKKKLFFWYFYYLKSCFYMLYSAFFHKEIESKFYAGKSICGLAKTEKHILRFLKLKKPFCLTRFGAVEMNVLKKFEYSHLTGKPFKKEALNLFCKAAGFFPNNEQDAKKFYQLTCSLLHEIDLLGIWHLPMEEYFIKKYMKDLRITTLPCIDPINYAKIPWSKALKGKRVLVIHPFSETIKAQYQNRDKLFKNKDILVDFNLICLKAVQTMGEEKDDRFHTWFEALDYMYQEALKLDFDVALIGCGAYGMPLALKLKKAGKQAIHLGGGLQLLFGIKGKRWDECGFYNEYWVRPMEEETPKGFQEVENGCYW